MTRLSCAGDHRACRRNRPVLRRTTAGFGGVATAAPGTSGKYGWLPVTFLPGMVIMADKAAGTTWHLEAHTRRSARVNSALVCPGRG